MLDVAQNKS